MPTIDLGFKFPEMRPLRVTPMLWTINGCGFGLYGSRGRDEETGTLDLGMVVLRRAQAMADPAARRSELEKAEKMVCFQLNRLTGEPAMRDRAVALIEKSVALDPSNSPGLENAAHLLRTAAFTERGF